MYNGSATLAWNVNTEPDLAKYTVYMGTAPGVYTTVTEIGTAETSFTARNLAHNTRYFFALTATDTSNNESAYSPEVSKLIIVSELLVTRRAA